MEPRQSPEGAAQVYNNFLGLDIWGDVIAHPLTGELTAFMNTGDPLLHTGWLDDLFSDPCDVYFMQGSGPFQLAPGDTQRIVYAFVVGAGETHLASIEALRQNVNLVRDAFLSGFQVAIAPDVSARPVGASEWEVALRVNVKGSVSTVFAELKEYDGTVVQILPLLDDGAHGDGAAGDGLYGNQWRTPPRDRALTLDVRVFDAAGREHVFRHAVDKITVNNAVLVSSVQIVDDDGNYDHRVNPGENVRLVATVSNGLAEQLRSVSYCATVADPHVRPRLRHLFLSDVDAGSETALTYDIADSTTYFELDVATDTPDTHAIALVFHLWDDLRHHWLQEVRLPVEPYPYVPNEIVPRHTAGRGDARFRIRVLDPGSLTGHAYALTVADSITPAGDKGFNLIDLATGDTLLAKHPPPDRHAYNVPVTDGFKVVEAYLPQGGLRDARLIEVEGGHPTALVGLNLGGDFLGGGLLLGRAPHERFYRVELEFTNAIGVDGVVGEPAGQKGFRYEIGTPRPPTAFVPCPFNVWKIVGDQRVGLLNVCFQENPYLPTYDGVWAPDTSRFGGFEVLYVMATDYDPNGQIYQGKPLQEDDVLYKLHLRLASGSSVVDVGDVLFFDWEYEATSEDRFEFVPTGLESEPRETVPTGFSLLQNYPNPFNTSTTIRFAVDRPGRVTLTVYNALGQRVKTILDRRVGGGEHVVRWSGEDDRGRPVGSGVYLLRLEGGGRVRCVKMVLLR